MRGGGRKADWCRGSGSGDSVGPVEEGGVNPAANWGGATGKFRGPVKTVRSGIFVQSAHFSRLFYSLQAGFRCFHA